MAALISVVVASLPYILLSPLQPYPLSWLVKLLPLFVLAWGGRRVGMPWLWWVGLAASAVGDVLLDLNRKGNLQLGIAAFSIGYILFSIEFWKTALSRGVAVARSAALVVYVIAFAAVIIPGAGDLRIPVLVYALVLANLGVSASLGLPGWIGFAGACSLVLSDTLIGLDEFGAGVSVPRAIIISTYYLGQWAVAVGLARRDD